MKIIDLYKFKKIKYEISQIKTHLDEIDTLYISTPKLDGMPHKNENKGSAQEKVLLKKLKLEEKLNKKYVELIEKHLEIEDFLDTVPDEELRIIIRLKFIDCKTWQEVAKELKYDRTTPYYKLKNYLEKKEKEEDKNGLKI